MLWTLDIIENARRSPILSFLRGRKPRVTSAENLARTRDDSREHPRTSVALAATLHHGSTKASVTIANLSRGGAMIKTSLVPSLGSDVQLVREGMSSKAVVVWSSRDCCGIRFLKEVRVGAWLLPLGTDGKLYVDQTEGPLVSREFSLKPTSAAASALNRPPAEQRLNDLMIVRRLLESLQADLSSSSVTMMTHGARMLLFDTATKMLSEPELRVRPTHQFIDGLCEIFELVRELEDELTSCTDTLVQHSYKLQHLDFAMQMLTEISAEALSNKVASSTGTTRLCRLRTACVHALRLQ